MTSTPNGATAEEMAKEALDNIFVILDSTPPEDPRDKLMLVYERCLGAVHKMRLFDAWLRWISVELLDSGDPEVQRGLP